MYQGMSRAIMVTKQQQIPQSRKIVLWLITAVLWLLTVVLGFLAFIAFQDIATTGVTMVLGKDTELGLVARRGWITTTRNFSTFVAGLLWLAMVIFGIEYHFRYVGQRRSLRILFWTLGIELGLILLSVFVF